jgi:hypothetical protein
MLQSLADLINTRYTFMTKGIICSKFNMAKKKKKERDEFIDPMQEKVDCTIIKYSCRDSSQSSCLELINFFQKEYT